MIARNQILLTREEYLRKRRKRRNIRYSLFFGFLVLIVGVLSYVAHRKEVRINSVTLQGGLLVTEKEVSDEANSFLKGSYFWLVPKNNAFVYPREALEKDILEKFKRIETIRVYLDGLDKMVVEITERKPVAIWCGNTLENSTATTTEGVIVVKSEKCYFIDLYSTIFAPAPDFSGDAYFKYYGLVDKPNPIGEKFIASSTQFLEINSFIEAVKKLSIKPLYLKAKGEDEFSLVLFGGAEIYFDVRKSLALAYSNLESLLKTPELSIKKTGYLPVDYIDLRYGNKLFYKL